MRAWVIRQQYSAVFTYGAAGAVHPFLFVSVERAEADRILWNRDWLGVERPD